MINVDTRICELLEAVMAQEPEHKNIQTLSETVMGFMDQTNNLVQRNLYKWSDDRIKKYGLRVPRYGSVLQALHSINIGKPTLEIIELGLNDSKLLYHDINNEFSFEWEAAESIRRKAILEEILVPHMLITRFLERYRNERF